MHFFILELIATLPSTLKMVIVRTLFCGVAPRRIANAQRIKDAIRGAVAMHQRWQLPAVPTIPKQVQPTQAMRSATRESLNSS
mmetsp:Transcript_5839/g.11578  ORF Transcript_5839/g.11578 Transcript_5839/m.11578 type:complete len:83 (-) Transcript_5839:187-435(-)